MNKWSKFLDRQACANSADLKEQSDQGLHNLPFWLHHLDAFTRASTNFQNQEVQDFQASKFGSKANETWTMKDKKSAFFWF